MICNFQISKIMAAIFRYWKLFSHVQSDRPYWCWADTKHNKFHYYIKITSQHHVEITMTLQLRHICSLDKINPVWRCPSNVCMVYPRNGEMKRCSTLFNNVDRGLTLFNFMHFDGYILSSIQVGLSFESGTTGELLTIIQLFIYELWQWHVIISSKITHILSHKQK